LLYTELSCFINVCWYLFYDPLISHANPSHSLSPDEQDGVIRRFHMCETGLQKAVKAGGVSGGGLVGGSDFRFLDFGF
jgi:hypothetical protein